MTLETNWMAFVRSARITVLNCSRDSKKHSRSRLCHLLRECSRQRYIQHYHRSIRIRLISTIPFANCKFALKFAHNQTH